MPTYENISSNNSSGHGNSGAAYSKLFAIFNKQITTNPLLRSSSAQVSLKEHLEYEEAVKSFDPSGYTRLAGCDLGAMFMPFESTIGSGQMPSFHSSTEYKFTGSEDPSGVNVRLHTLLPFQWNPEESGYLYMKSVSPSGDSMPYLLSGRDYTGDINNLRDVDLIRSIGIRLPAMGVGWGYTTDNLPWPKGTTDKKFKGDVDVGWEVNPIDYVAAPLDFRYDKYRNVWTMPRGFWAQVTSNTSGTGQFTGTRVYSWTERLPNVSGIVGSHPSPRTGNSTDNPAVEVNNNLNVPDNSIVWIEPRDRLDSYYFAYSSSSSDFYARLTATSQDGTNKRWRYGFTEVTKTTAGYGGWTDKSGGTVGSGYNLIEDQNSVSGTYGNGVNASNLTGTFSIKPAPTGLRVKMSIVSVGGASEYWFSYENAIDGGC